MDTQRLLDQRIGMLAVKKGLIGMDEYQAVLKEQRLMTSKSDGKASFAELLMSKGWLTKEQLVRILPPHREPLKPSTQPAQRNSSSTKTDEVTDIKETAEAAGLKETAEATDVEDASGAAGDEPDKTVEVEIESLFVLTVSDDSLTASITPAKETFADITLEDVKKLILEHMIKQGVVEDTVIEDHLKSDANAEKPLIIAQGKPPKQGVADEIKYYFDTNPFRVGTLTEKGNMDWKNHGEIPQVEEKELLAEIILGRDGTPGIDVFGREIPPAFQAKAKLIRGKGVEKSDDGLKFYAKTKGTAKVSDTGELTVLPIYEIDGDVGIETGHVEYFGHIEVKGRIHAGYRVKGKSLRADEISGGEIDIEEDITVIGGIFNVNLKTTGNVTAHHIHRSNITAKGDVTVRKEIIECKIGTCGKCTVDGGRILTSEISAKRGIQAGEVGSEAAAPCLLTVGIDLAAKESLMSLRIKKKILEKEETGFQRTLKALREKSEQINTKLGEIAQIQDKYMLEKRDLMALVNKAGEQATSFEQKRLDKIEGKVLEIDSTVENLMEEDERITTSITEHEEQIEGCRLDLKTVQEKMTEVNEILEKDPGTPIVQVSGEVFPGTRIIGPHASVTVDDTYRRVIIREIKNTDPHVRDKWMMNISAK